MSRMDDDSLEDDSPAPAPRRWWRGFAVVWYGTLAALVLLTLYVVSAPLGYFMPMLLLLLAWPAFGVATLLWYIASAIRRRSLWPRAVHWVPVAVVAVTAAAVLLDIPVLARYTASRSAMDDLVVEAKHHPKRIEKRARVGLWRVEGVQAYEGGVRFLVRNTGFLDQGGFAYSENGPPPNLGGEDHYEHLHGNWYTWWQSW